jgi:hypothetical protein
VVLLVLAAASARARADTKDDQRAGMGAKMFRSIVASDLQLEKKRTAPDGPLLVVFFHVDDPKRTRQLAEVFSISQKGRDAQPIKTIPVVVELCTDPTFATYADRIPAAIFIAQDVEERTVRKIVEFGVAHHVITYSPFEGHVESGVLGGLFVDAQIKPFLNRKTMQDSGVSLSATLLMLSKVYE